MSTAGHTSVMVKEVVEALNIRPDGTYVDATFGRGGHTRAILECLGPAGRVLAIDRDPDACRYGHEVFANEPRMLLVQARFSDLAEIIEREGLRQRITGMVFDLGVSSPQLDNASRGFSFQKQGPLDMRMDFSTGECTTACAVNNNHRACGIDFTMRSNFRAWQACGDPHVPGAAY